METTSLSQEIVTARTSDGWDLRIFHYLPLKGNVARFPVILCHGLAANKHSCDFEEMGSAEWERYSLAAYLLKERTNDEPVFNV
jgi:hypothetical protein